MVKRELYLQKLIDFQNQPLIKVMAGMRRSGKSTLLAMFKEHLLSHGISPEAIIQLNFELMLLDPVEDYRQLYQLIKRKMQGKGHVYLPKYTSSEKITYTNDFFNNNWYDKEFSESIYEQAYSSRSKQMLAIHIYKKTKNSDIGAYLRRAGKTIVKRMIDEGDEAGAVEFLQFGLMTTTALKAILKNAEAKGAAAISSYILIELNSKKQPTFRL